MRGGSRRREPLPDGGARLPSRRDALRWAGVGAAVLALGTGCTRPRAVAGTSTAATTPAAGVEGAVRTTASGARAHVFVTRPDLTPPVLEPTTGDLPGTSAASQRHGNVLALGPKDLDKHPAMQGVLLVDGAGEPVYVRPTGEGPFDVRVQQYRGEPVLTFWHGTSTNSGSGNGWVDVLDTRYRRVARVTTAGSVGTGHADIHETTITAHGTMLLLAYVRSRADLSPLGGRADGWVLEGVVQEVDVATGAVRFEWRSLDHVPVTDSYAELEDDAGTHEKPYDYIHLNAVEEDVGDKSSAGAASAPLLVSARNTHTVYRLSRRTGEVEWRLGGKASDWTIGPGAAFAWQHDARRHVDGSVTLFDNSAAPATADTSRGLRLRLDEDTRTAQMLVEYLPGPGHTLSGTQGNVQVLWTGDVVVGWGELPFFGQYHGDGTPLWEATFTAGSSYRVYRCTWHATPLGEPDVVLADDAVHVSWNGATDVARWRVRTGGSRASARWVATAPRTGFETAVPWPAGVARGRVVVVEAVGADGAVQGAAVI